MPTPESAAFLAKKPTVAPTYEGVDFEDNVAVHNARDAIIREQWVRSMMSRLVGEELGKCYAREGVNHFEKCGVLRAIALSNWFGPAWSRLYRAQAEPAGPGVDMSEQLLTYSLHRTEKYFELLNERKIKGYLFQEKNSYPGNTAKSS
ncbi:NADH-ubiquinone oxidoreductase [Penicillium waksmanii]|uniref:NADH-ubiquinone oxidoreductase n=1 Tax=Penicillium waksmanii TaxID=69791 RepID=UPI002548CF27|nr:NADH-ubiquinone oxidoreductase [Penicillium waksmanii]KAJ5999752.1 NADH-ubiquinone oxidoreductase [Penicillium waksmanii]